MAWGEHPIKPFVGPPTAPRDPMSALSEKLMALLPSYMSGTIQDRKSTRLNSSH